MLNRLASLLLIILAVSICAWLWRTAILQNIGQLLVVDQRNSEFDHLLLASSNLSLDTIAQLLHQDNSRHIVIAEPCPTRTVKLKITPSYSTITRQALTARGVPPEKISVIFCEAPDDLNTVIALKHWLEEHRTARVLLVCDRFRSFLFRHLVDTTLDTRDASRVSIFAQANPRFDETNWWTNRAGVKGFFHNVIGIWCQGDEPLETQTWNPDDYERSLRQATSGVSQ